MAKQIIAKSVKFYRVGVYSDGEIWLTNFHTTNQVILKGNTRRHYQARYFHVSGATQAARFISRCAKHNATPPRALFDVLDGSMTCTLYDTLKKEWF